MARRVFPSRVFSLWRRYMDNPQKIDFNNHGWLDYIQEALCSSSVSIMQQDRNLRFTNVCNAPFGIPANDMLGRTDDDVTERAEEGRALAELKRKVMVSGQTTRSHVAVHVGGELRHFDMIVSPVLRDDHSGHDDHDEYDQPAGVVTLVIDISEQKSAEKKHHQIKEVLENRISQSTEVANLRTRQLQALAVDLIEAEERERGRIADLLHDDLQQILVSAMLQLQSTQASVSNPVVEKVIHLLDQSIQKSRKLSHELSPAVLHHSGLAAALEWLIGQMKEQHGLSVDLETDDWDDGEAEHQKVFVFRAVQELLFNVVKHAQTARASLRLSCNQGLVVTVSDAGAGFDTQNLDRSGRGSSGFGLLSIRERADSMGGSFTLESEPGKGSTFTLILPRVSSSSIAPIRFQSPADATSSPVGEKTGEPERYPKSVPRGDQLRHKSPGEPGLYRVLFVDDHQVMRQGLISMVKNKPGIRVVGEASTGREAVEMALQLYPDVIVMDVSLPEIDGIEATRLIKKQLPDTRVIGLSMFDDEGTAGMMRNAGAEAFISKAESSGTLLKVIYGIDG